MKKKVRVFVIGLMTFCLLIGASGCANLDLGIFNALKNTSGEASKAADELSKAAEEASGAMGEASEAAEEAMKRAEEEAKRAMEEASKAADEAMKKAEEEARALQQSIANRESYEKLKEQWDEASRRQQSRADEIMGRNQGSSSSSGNTSSTPKVPVSGTWYGPKNAHTGDRSSVTLNSDGTAKVTIDLGASEWVTFSATYTSEKAGTYEYDDIVCRVTLSGNVSRYGFPSNTFTFIIDPEVENGMYARFVDSGFGVTPGDSTFTK